MLKIKFVYDNILKKILQKKGSFYGKKIIYNVSN